MCLAPQIGPQRLSMADTPHMTWLRMRAFTIEIESTLDASADEVWSQALTMEGVNEELMPWIRMTVPRAARGKRLDEFIARQEAFTSVLLLLGMLPFDVHHLTLVSVFQCGFDEESWSWLHRRWSHQRRVVPASGGCVVTDRVTVEPRFTPPLILRPIVGRIFEARNRRLRSRFSVRQSHLTV